MPDGQTIAAPSPQDLMAKTASPLSSGSGFFHGLLETLVTGAFKGVSGAMSQMHGTPQMESIAAGFNESDEEQKKLDENKERQIRVAMAQLNYQQAYHALVNADRPIQQHGYDVARDYAQELEKNGMVNWEGGESEDRAALMQDLQKTKQQFPNAHIYIMPKGGTTLEQPRWGIARVLDGSLQQGIEGLSLPGVPEKGIPATTIAAPKGMSAGDATAHVMYNLKNGLVDAIQGSSAVPLDATEPAPLQTDNEQLNAFLVARNLPRVSNLTELRDIANGRKPLKDLQATSTRSRDGWTLGRDHALSFIKNFINQNYSEDIADRVMVFDKSLTKAEGDYALENGKNAGQAIETAKQIIEANGGGAPELLQRAQKLLTNAKPWDARYQKSLEQKSENKDFEHEKALFDQRLNRGVDMYGRKLTFEEADMTMPVDAFGNPIPKDYITAWKPGQMQQNTAATASTLIQKLQRIKQRIQAAPNLVGPIGGTVGELKSKYGLSDHDAQELYDDITTAQSGFTKMHTSRFSNEILQKSVTMLNPRMNKDQAMGALDSMLNTAELYEKDDKLMSKAEYMQHAQNARAAKIAKMTKYLLAVPGYVAGQKPTDAQKKTAQQLAQADGQEF